MEEKYCPQSLGALASAAFVKNRSQKNLMDFPISVISAQTLRIVASLANHYTNITYWIAKNKKYNFIPMGFMI